MSPDDKQAPQNESGAPRSKGARKPYSRPRLRSLGKVSAITLASGDVAKKKPQG
jgi:hypothetical protein